MTQGTGRAHGALTVVNAIPTGHGAAVGLDLATEATVDVAREAGSVEVEIEDAPTEDPALAEACLAVVGEALGTELSGRVVTRSELPIAKGMKSSSVAANAIVLALLDALDETADPERVLELSVAAARRAGVTVTGALDDAAASLLGGLVVTDNRQDRVLHRQPLNTDQPVLVLVPRDTRYTADTGSLDDAIPVAERCLELARDDWPAAMTLNGLAIAASTDQGLDPAYRALAAGALGAGLTGTGPATGAVCPDGGEVLVRRAWEPYTAQGHGILSTRLTDEGLGEGAA